MAQNNAPSGRLAIKAGPLRGFAYNVRAAAMDMQGRRHHPANRKHQNEHR